MSTAAITLACVAVLAGWAAVALSIVTHNRAGRYEHERSRLAEYLNNQRLAARAED